ncbi:MAG: DUF2169 domain-containing protein [Rhizobacter sp.]
MVLAVHNFTPYTHQTLPMTARNGATILRIVVKGGFDITADGRTEVSAKQPPVVLEDVHWGKPGVSALRYESEVILGKPKTDLLVNGSACAPGGRPVAHMEVGLAYKGRVIKRMRVTGSRVWRRGPLGWYMSQPEPFTTMPVTFDRAFGGIDAAGAEPRNHSGVGFASQPGRDFEGSPAPNVEFADKLVSSISDRPPPAGMGVVARHWEPRKRYAGTYDQAWLDERFPLLPDDFDDRFFQTAPEDQWLDAPEGGEQIGILGMSPQGKLLFSLPPCRMAVTLHYADRKEEPPVRLETVMVEPTDGRLILTWATTACIHGDPFKLHDIEIWPASATGEPPTPTPGE